MGCSMKSLILRFALIIPVLFSLGSLADARPRDEVMSQAFRCGAVSDPHQWLDCIYGSAQPVRAELGLPPVTQAQARLVAAPPSGGPISDQGTRDMVLSSALRCDSLATERPWLDCYYAAANAMRSELGLSPSDDRRGPEVQTARPVLATPALGAVTGSRDTASFGLMAKSRTAARIVSPLASYAFDRYGIFTVTLANGQVWRQLTGDTSYAHWKEPPASYTVAITKGALGSYSLRVKSGPGLFKVERVS